MTSAIHGYNEVYQARYFIEAEGQIANDIARNITSFTYSQDAKGADTLTIVVANPDLTLIDDPRFQAGVRFRVRWGYPGDFSETRNVIISKAKPSFAKGTPSITMVAFDLRVEINKKAKPFNWGNKSSSDIAQAIAKRWGLGMVIEDSKDARSNQQRTQPVGTTDIQYLMSLADKINYDCYIDDTVLHYHPKKYNDPPVLTFIYYTSGVGTVLSFDPEVKMSKPQGAGVKGANQKDAHPTGGKGNDDQTPKMGARRVQADIQQGTAMVVAGGLQGKIPKGAGGDAVTHPTAEADKKNVRQQANALQSKIDMSAVKAKLTVIGAPRVKAHLNIRIEGVGKTYSGNWRVETCSHKIDAKGVYVTEMGLTRNALNAGKKKVAGHVNDSKGGGAGDAGDGGASRNRQVKADRGGVVAGGLSPRTR